MRKSDFGTFNFWDKSCKTALATDFEKLALVWIDGETTLALLLISLGLTLKYKIPVNIKAKTKGRGCADVCSEVMGVSD
jgi:hypothetical protein